MVTSIRVSDETHARLSVLKRENESYDELLARLSENDKWALFGLLDKADTDELRANAEETREEIDATLEARTQGERR